MSRLFAFNMVTLDGYFEGPGHDLGWHNVDSEFNEFAIGQLRDIGTLIFGRVTYEMMASYWSTAAAKADDPVVAGLMNDLPKIVPSRTLDKVAWSNSRLIRDRVGEEIASLRQRSTKDLAVFGSARLLTSLMQMNLVDEYRLMVNPIVLGQGTPLFRLPMHKLNLRLIRTRIFGNGNVLLCYEAVSSAD